jgi:hypothetical protein
MRKRISVAIPMVALVLAYSGCGPKEGMNPVSGQVLFKGKPAAGAIVYFQPTGIAAPPGSFVVPMATVQDDGWFSIHSDDEDGAIAGSYNVLVEWRDDPVSTGTGERKIGTPASKATKTALEATKVGLSRVRRPDRLRGRYLDNGRPLLKAEVKPGSNKLSAFDVTD